MEGRPGSAGWAPKPSISYSSMRLYDQCPRAWLMRYGPECLPLNMRAAARVEGRLSPTAALAGSVVDKVITDALYCWHRGGERPRNLFPNARRCLRETLCFSREWAAAVRAGCTLPRGPFQPVESEFYGDGWTDNRKAEILGIIELCLQNLQQGGVLETIQECARDTWRLPPRKACPWFWWGTSPVYAKWDFATSSAVQTIVYDWKTGKPNDNAISQLHLYAAYAMITWNARREDIRLVPVWLRSGAAEPHLVSRTVMEALGLMVVERHQMIVETLEATRKRDALELFPMVQDPSACRGCTFRSCLEFGRSPEGRPACRIRPVHEFHGKRS